MRTTRVHIGFGLALSIFVLLANSKNVRAGSLTADYWELRARLFAEENEHYIGGNLKFEKNEEAVNDVIMAEKNKTLDIGYKDTRKFLPAQNFLNVAEDIAKTPLYSMIRKIPKGAVLHAHEFGLTSTDFVFKNITFRPNLYICEANNTLKFFKNPPKDCSWQLLSYLRNKTGMAPLVKKRISKEISMYTADPEKAYPHSNEAWAKFRNIFIYLGSFLTYKPVFEDYIYQGLQELYDDKVMYIELRSTLPNLYDLEGNILDPKVTVRSLKETSERFVKDHRDFLGMKLIYAPLRKIDQGTFDEYASMALEIKNEFPDFLAGFDLVGQEDKGEPLTNFADKLAKLGNEMKYFFHAGETNWIGASADLNLFDAVLLNTTRIGHGYSLLKHPKIMEIIKKKEIAIEVNPISNQVLALVKDLRNHPASDLFARNYPVIVSCDDPGLWKAQGLSYDFYEAFVGIMSRNADLRVLKKLAENSILYSSLDKQDKKSALKLWRQQWSDFLESEHQSASSKLEF